MKHLKQTSLDGQGVLEKELEKFICSNPEVLGLGELSIIESQCSQEDGVLDILAYQEPTNTYYEIELMRGIADARHITRVLDYWAQEKKRKLFSNHVAVLVCEARGRYTTLLQTLPQFVPLITLKLSVYRDPEPRIVFTPLYFPEEFRTIGTQHLYREDEASRNPLTSENALSLIEHLLEDPEWVNYSYREIASEIGVSHGLVGIYLREMQNRQWIESDNGKRTIIDEPALRHHLKHMRRIYSTKS